MAVGRTPGKSAAPPALCCTVETGATESEEAQQRAATRLRYSPRASAVPDGPPEFPLDAAGDLGVGEPQGARPPHRPAHHARQEVRPFGGRRRPPRRHPDARPAPGNQETGGLQLLVGAGLTNYLIRRGLLPKRINPLIRRSYAALATLSGSYSSLWGKFPRVTQPSAARRQVVNYSRCRSTCMC